MAALNRKIASGKTESQPLANSVYLVKPIKSKAVKVEPPGTHCYFKFSVLLIHSFKLQEAKT